MSFQWPTTGSGIGLKAPTLSDVLSQSRQGSYIPDYSLSTQIPRIPTVTPQTPMPGSDYPIFNQSPAYTGQGISAPSGGFWSNQGEGLTAARSDDFWSNQGLDYSSLGSYGKGLGGGPGGAGGDGFAFNIPTGKLVLGGLESLGKLWSGFQGAKLAKKSFEHTRDITNANLNNQISAYNTALEDRARARFIGEGRGDGSAAEREYVARNRLSR